MTPSDRKEINFESCYADLKKFLPDKFMRKVPNSVTDSKDSKKSREELNNVIDGDSDGGTTLFNFSKFLFEKVWMTGSGFQTWQNGTSTAHTFQLLLFYHEATYGYPFEFKYDKDNEYMNMAVGLMTLKHHILKLMASKKLNFLLYSQGKKMKEAEIQFVSTLFHGVTKFRITTPTPTPGQKWILDGHTKFETNSPAKDWMQNYSKSGIFWNHVADGELTINNLVASAASTAAVESAASISAIGSAATAATATAATSALSSANILKRKRLTITESESDNGSSTDRRDNKGPNNDAEEEGKYSEKCHCITCETLGLRTNRHRILTSEEKAIYKEMKEGSRIQLIQALEITIYSEDAPYECMVVGPKGAASDSLYLAVLYDDHYEEPIVYKIHLDCSNIKSFKNLLISRDIPKPPPIWLWENYHNDDFELGISTAIGKYFSCSINANTDSSDKIDTLGKGRIVWDVPGSSVSVWVVFQETKQIDKGATLVDLSKLKDFTFCGKFCFKNKEDCPVLEDILGEYDYDDDDDDDDDTDDGYFPGDDAYDDTNGNDNNDCNDVNNELTWIIGNDDSAAALNQICTLSDDWNLKSFICVLNFLGDCFLISKHAIKKIATNVTKDWQDHDKDKPFPILRSKYISNLFGICLPQSIKYNMNKPHCNSDINNKSLPLESNDWNAGKNIIT